VILAKDVWVTGRLGDRLFGQRGTKWSLEPAWRRHPQQNSNSILWIVGWHFHLNSKGRKTVCHFTFCLSYYTVKRHLSLGRPVFFQKEKYCGAVVTINVVLKLCL